MTMGFPMPVAADDEAFGEPEEVLLLLQAASTEPVSARMLAAASVFTVVRFIV
jgi:hypothetical protein